MNYFPQVVTRLVPCQPPKHLVPCRPPAHLVTRPRPGAAKQTVRSVANPGPSVANPGPSVANPGPSVANPGPGSSQVPSTSVLTTTAPTPAKTAPSSESRQENSSSLFDIDESDDLIGKIQKALEKQNASSDKKNEKIVEQKSEEELSLKSNNLQKTTKTFSKAGSRKPPPTERKPIQIVNKLEIETVVVPPSEASLELQTLSLVTFDSDDPDFDLVKKLGACVGRDQASSQARTSAATATTTSSTAAKQVIYSDWFKVQIRGGTRPSF